MNEIKESPTWAGVAGLLCGFVAGFLSPWLWDTVAGVGNFGLLFVLVALGWILTRANRASGLAFLVTAWVGVVAAYCAGVDVFDLKDDGLWVIGLGIEAVVAAVMFSLTFFLTRTKPPNSSTPGEDDLLPGNRHR